jgi:hypothetical protein
VPGRRAAHIGNETKKQKMDRILDRAFNKTHSVVEKVIEGAPEAVKARAKQTRDDKLRGETAPMSAADVVARIDLAWRDNDYFRCAVLLRVLLL